MRETAGVRRLLHNVSDCQYTWNISVFYSRLVLELVYMVTSTYDNIHGHNMHVTQTFEYSHHVT